MEVSNKDVSIVWPLALKGLPVSIVIFVVSLVINYFSNLNFAPESITYAPIMSSALLFFLFGLSSIFFSFYTLSVAWDSLNFTRTIKYFVLLIVFNFFSGYIFAKLWHSQTSIDIYSLAGKRKLGFFDPVALIFYFLTIISIIVPLFIIDQST
jgi:hypothetical protein